MGKPFFKKILWAVDTLEPMEFQQNAQLIIGSLTRQTPSEVYPVHVQNFLLPDGEALNTYEEAYQALAEKRMKQLKESSDIANLESGDILINREGKVRLAILMLLEYAGKKSADLIVASTHSYKGIDKFFLGSFAETLLLKSNIPLITVNPKTKVREKISKVLLPATFDEKFRPAFHKTMELCSTLGARLISSLTRLPFSSKLVVQEPNSNWERNSQAETDHSIHYRILRAHQLHRMPSSGIREHICTMCI